MAEFKVKEGTKVDSISNPSKPKVKSKKKEEAIIEGGGPFGKMRVEVKGEWSDWVWSNQIEGTIKKMSAE